MKVEELKKLVEELQKAFSEFKSANDQRLKQIETKGHVDPVLDQKVDKANADISRIEQEMKAVQTAMNRKAATTTEKEDKSLEHRAQTAAFNKFVRKGEHSLSPEEVKLLSTQDDSNGGYLVDHEMEQGIIRSAQAVNAIRGLANVRTISKGSSLEERRRTAGVSATRVGETGSNPAASNPTFGMLKIDAPEMRFLGQATAAMLEDSAFNVEQMLADEAGEAFGNKEGAEFVSGNGVTQAQGFTTLASGTGDGQVEQVVSGTAATVADADGQANGLVTMQHSLKAVYAKNAAWVLNRQTTGSIRKMKDSQKNYIWSPGLAGNPPTILNLPYAEDDNMAVEGAGNLVIALADWKRAYKIVDRLGIAVTRDPFSSKPDVQFLFRKRVGGGVEIFEAIKLLKCST
jgi:HK97 family phage major capsid protein